MGIGYLLLYGALALVALWLTAELLLQNRAPLHWRALALLGFLGVVAGMRASSVPVIVAGAAGFGLGQLMVTGAVRRGRPVGWSLRRSDGRLPGSLAKVPLLAAATGGTAAAAAAPEPVVPVGEVGPVEDEPYEAHDPYAGQFAGYEEFQQLDAGVYADDQSAYQVPQQPQYGYVQQQDYGYQQQYVPQQPQPQPQLQLIGYDQYGQPVYQDPYTQQQYQQPYVPQQQPQQDQNWYYQQQY
ncbi:hypothetical protein HUT16_09170 [Kitasatospora sp. NA04385]|uniref:hypothetical protein n=1 Tax=Kitasatospora sp. NA04385 TaxID=2742135 RepID=UPI00159244E8|nr:hypothetical protein [Kitasatospora sp. NA04385]QKW19211.1 hypothetical protein HUT16_09170 [Kitasatospora sp. NA04385]